MVNEQEMKESQRIRARIEAKLTSRSQSASRTKGLMAKIKSFGSGNISLPKPKKKKSKNIKTSKFAIKTSVLPRSEGRRPVYSNYLTGEPLSKTVKRKVERLLR